MIAVTGITFDQKTGELVITTQDLQIQNNAIAAVGNSTVNRIPIARPGVTFDIHTHCGADTGWEHCLVAEATNTGLIPVYSPEVSVIIESGQMKQRLIFSCAGHCPPIFLPGQKREYYLPLDRPYSLNGATLKAIINGTAAASIRIAMEAPRDTEVGMLPGAELKAFIAQIP